MRCGWMPCRPWASTRTASLPAWATAAGRSKNCAATARFESRSPARGHRVAREARVAGDRAGVDELHVRHPDVAHLRVGAQVPRRAGLALHMEVRAVVGDVQAVAL